MITLLQTIKNLKSNFRKNRFKYESSQLNDYIFPTDLFTDNQELAEERYLKAEKLSQQIQEDLWQLLPLLFKNIIFIDKTINTRNSLFKYKFKNVDVVLDTRKLEKELIEALHIQNISIARNGYTLEISIPHTDFDQDDEINTFAVPIDNRKVFENVRLEKKTEYIIGVSQENEVIKGNMDSNQKSMLLTGDGGTGKTNWFHQILLTMMAHNNPDDIKFYIMDFKRSTDYLMYNDLPYMLENPIYDIEIAEKTFNFISEKIEQRRKLFSENEVQDIDEYNNKEDTLKINKLPRWIIFVDEYAPLNIDSTSTNALIALLKKINRSEGVGIHLFISTSIVRKTNLLDEIKFYIDKQTTLKLSSLTASQISIDKPCAETLLNHGDMLIEITDNLNRIQNLYISDNEIRKITNYLKDKYDVS
ncbi:FtsK/SpoIIIE domain-containing protein [Staphylococcus equorum]|uniref:FtsK/SpoIIIE domain-containing protein n=1 Tax=Staphylococcus equorum TaxID=246432 RepID=A0A9X4LAU6_9STAP|nr:FtsK/SpoIIIE domain-containing protein [Staphylococcus equorum]MDG0820704.1 FtsK/SpoIIIE domain-containing protein [Staphylococcus equorum]MDG0841329.1 FtsK/SpoIIIE domain-containing protein [Staphylococcus equorum]MDG0847029.1 FtsK/SpoIIIE domain-containing protein [Staphylococcus equorum]PTE82304.1 hypothetical protein BUY85_00775 [Staphylococcus equorum]